ncbi:MAG: tetratricopeptide repeat protein [Clostridiaceae bacterium]|nr:tetratricopeptide repeat protein [Clostridiaceae bacterium]
METNNVSQVEEYNQQGKVLYSLEKYNEAIEMYRKGESEDPMYKDTYFNLGEAYVMLDQYDKAKESFNKVILIDKKSGITYFHLGNVEFLLGNNDLGREYYAKAINNEYDDAQLYVNLATIAEEVSNNGEAIKNYNKAIARDKFRVDAKLRKALIYIGESKYDEALQTLDNMLEFNPEIFEGHHYKALVNIEMGNYSEAERTLEKASSLFPDDDGFAFDRIILLEKQEKYDEALNLINVRYGDSQERNILLEKAKILLAKEKIDEATTLFEQVKETEEVFDDETRFYLINIYINTNKVEKALSCSEDIITNAEKNSFYFAAIYYKALCLTKLGRVFEAKVAYEEAIKIFRFASSSNPGMLDLVIYRALCYKELRDYNKALEMVNYLIAISEDMGEAYLIRAEIYQELNEIDKADADRSAAASKSKVLGMLMNPSSK